MYRLLLLVDLSVTVMNSLKTNLFVGYTGSVKEPSHLSVLTIELDLPKGYFLNFSTIIFTILAMAFKLIGILD